MKTFLVAMAMAFLAACGGSTTSGEPCGNNGGTCLSSCAHPDSSSGACAVGLTCCLPQQ